jgi:hypothetical protein
MPLTWWITSVLIRKLLLRGGIPVAEKSVTAILSGYFNQGDGKRPLTAWRDELKALTDAEKRELADGVCVITGDTIK